MCKHNGTRGVDCSYCESDKSNRKYKSSVDYSQEIRNERDRLKIENKQLQTTNKELLSALELIAAVEHADQRAREVMANSMIHIAKYAITDTEKGVSDENQRSHKGQCSTE